MQAFLLLSFQYKVIPWKQLLAGLQFINLLVNNLSFLCICEWIGLVDSSGDVLVCQKISLEEKKKYLLSFGTL